MNKNILIVGGTSGVGLELARHYVEEGHTVCITGRNNPNLESAQFEYLSVSSDSEQLTHDIDGLLMQFTNINTLIYAAGYRQRGLIDALGDDAIKQMLNVGLLAPALMVQRLKNLLDTPLKIMLITSSSQYTARESEPVYCAVKSGMGMLGASLVRDQQIGKVLVAAPSGIDTAFWHGSDEDTSSMLEAKWVSDQIVDLSSGAFKYKYAKILRNPARVEIQETLDNKLQPI
ncbi:MAG: SDR family NAD(P)-dependent oxidoreductase [Granulosicoccaceae bacterium]